jgi:hypothetical protein
LEDGAKYKLSGRRVADFNKQKAGLKRISPPCHAEGTGKNEKCPDFGLFCVENAPE